MLGIVIGIGSVIAVVALGTGAKQSVQERIAKLGTTLLQVNAQRIAQGGVQLADPKRMTMADVKMLEERATKLSAIQPQQDRGSWSSTGARIRRAPSPARPPTFSR
ncbi:MAG: ABC transporter permease [Gemmatimonadaceae bacterium]